MPHETSDDRAIEELSTIFADPADALAAAELAEAERAVVQHEATAEQAAGVAAAGGVRRPEDRVRAWRAATGR
jgi:hypothetical protein